MKSYFTQAILLRYVFIRTPTAFLSFRVSKKTSVNDGSVNFENCFRFLETNLFFDMYFVQLRLHRKSKMVIVTETIDNS